MRKKLRDIWQRIYSVWCSDVCMRRIVQAALCLYVPIIIGVMSLVGSDAPFIGSDAVEYHTLAESIRVSGSFTLGSVGGGAVGVASGAAAEMFRTPGYPFFMALVRMITGTYWGVLWAQLICTIGSALLVYALGRRMYCARVGFVAAILFLCEPSVILYTVTSASDILFTFLFLVSVWLMFMGKSESSRARMAAAGLVLGAATLVRPIALYFCVPALVMYYIANRGDSRSHTSSRCSFAVRSLIYVGCIAVFVAPWMVRNYVENGAASLSSLPAFNMYHYNLPEYYAYARHESAGEARAALNRELPVGVQRAITLAHDNDDILKRGQYINTLNAISATHLQKDFIGYGFFHIVKTIPFFTASSLLNARDVSRAMLGERYLGSYARPAATDEPVNLSARAMSGSFAHLGTLLTSQWWAFAERFVWIIITLLAFVPLCTRRRWFEIFCIGTIMYFAILTGPVSYPRYRVPIEPLLLLSTTAGVAYLTKSLRT